MQTTRFPKMNPAPNFAGLPRFQVQVLSNDPNGIYRSFAERDGHTILARCCEDWSAIPDRTALLVMMEGEGTPRAGRLIASALPAEAEIWLEQPNGSISKLMIELVEAVYQPTMYVAGEVLILPPVTA